jgi:hypothetical protein
MEAKVMTWEELDYDPAVACALGLGYKTHGNPVRAYDGIILWVESFQWQILPDGSRETRRYRVSALMDTPLIDGRTVESFPFNKPGLVLEFDTEQEARYLLVKRVKGKI